ncbi:hypothetical protein M514_01321 [Trichuris suis]|uniref:WD repeat domain phosphoinositide-interacting protein 2 n=1 Tax=Trichuris suis TaxID=68888 RepID=A0A085NS20_9BILA|nr:hypothetical protein M513_01321 [Trichuris suis]KFD72266.1 hypothetical protein M514_01321 [Trichuris suis]
MSNCNEEILFLTFNQDATSLSLGTTGGYVLYTLGQLDELNQLHVNTTCRDVCIVERLFSSSLVTSVSLSAPRKVQVCHFQKNQEICSQSYANSILAVRLNRQRVVVCLEESICIHNIRDMKLLHIIRDTPSNPNGLCDLTASDVSYLAYPGSAHSGEVHIFDTANLQAVVMITAHNGALSALKFNSDGTRLASASEKGTVIRVFSIPSGERLFEFRRGIKRCASIYSLAFSSDSLFLCCTSNTETIHIFKLEHQDVTTSAEPISSVHDWVSFVGRTAASYLPSHVSDILQQERAFATARLPHAGCKNVCALVTLKQLPRLLVASTDGYLYIYNFNRVEGGECVLQKQHRLLCSTKRPSTGELLTGSPSSTDRLGHNSFGDTLPTRVHGTIDHMSTESSAPSRTLDL